MCNPSKTEILKQVKNYIKQSNAEAIYVATDNDPMEGFFQKELKNLKVLFDLFCFKERLCEFRN